MLKFEDVSKTFGEKTVLKSFSFSAAEGEKTCLLGASGSGKTTLIELAAGLLKPEHGKVIPFEHRRASFVFQEDRLLPGCSCLKNITLLGVQEGRARQYMQEIGLDGEEKKLPEELSGGMKRRLAIARALAFGGDLFFLDEPLRGLDIETARRVLELLKRELSGKTALIITHNPEEAGALGDRFVLFKGNPLTITADIPAGELKPGVLGKILTAADAFGGEQKKSDAHKL